MMTASALPIGVVLVNLGTPSQPTPSAIRRYLNAFLSDRRVVELSPWLWQPILKGLVLPFRARRLAKAYAQIWKPEGSPLLVHTQAQGRLLAQRLQAQPNSPYRVQVAMRYGEPSLQSALDRLREQGCERMLIVPLYPQFAASTSATIFDQVARLSQQYRDYPDYRFVKQFATHPLYIRALKRRIKALWNTQGTPQRLLLSFHGIPQFAVDAGDPYYRDCLATADALRQALAKYQVPIDIGFQSQFGKAKWIGPSTQSLLDSYPEQGVRSLDVICPCFMADCLETLEEIAQEGAKHFQQRGGQQFRYIPCLNDSVETIDLLEQLVLSHSQAWPQETIC